MHDVETLCRVISMDVTADELSGLYYLLTIDNQKACKVDTRFQPTRPPWANGVRLAMCIGLDKLDDFVNQLWKSNRCYTIEKILALTPDVHPDFQMLVWDAWPDLQGASAFEVDVASYTSVRASPRPRTPLEPVVPNIVNSRSLARVCFRGRFRALSMTTPVSVQTWSRSKKDALWRATKRADRPLRCVLADCADQLDCLPSFAADVPEGVHWCVKANTSNQATIHQAIGAAAARPSVTVCANERTRSIEINGVVGGSDIDLWSLQWAVRLAPYFSVGSGFRHGVKFLRCTNIHLALTPTQRADPGSTVDGGGGGGGGGGGEGSAAYALSPFRITGIEITLTDCNADLSARLMQAASGCMPNVSVLGDRAAAGPEIFMSDILTSSIVMRHGALDVTSAKTTQLRVLSNCMLALGVGSRSLPGPPLCRHVRQLTVIGSVSPAALAHFANLTHLDCFIESAEEAQAVMNLRELRVLGSTIRAHEQAVDALRSMLHRVLNMHTWPKLQRFNIKSGGGEPIIFGIADEISMEFPGVFQLAAFVARAVRVLGVELVVNL